MKQGNVKWFDCKKGYGFITPDGEVKDVFVHITQLEKSVSENSSTDSASPSISMMIAEDPPLVILNCCDFQSYNLMLTRKPAA